MSQTSAVLQSGVLLALTNTYPELKRSQWRKDAKALLPIIQENEGFPNDFIDVINDMPLIPDAFVVNKDDLSILFFEVEIYSPMNQNKLMTYGRLKADLAAFGVCFCVLVVNQYGHINEVDLMPYYAEWLEGVSA